MLVVPSAGGLASLPSALFDYYHKLHDICIFNLPRTRMARDGEGAGEDRWFLATALHRVMLLQTCTVNAIHTEESEWKSATIHIQ